MTDTTLVLATRNNGKIAEMNDILSDLPYVIQSAYDFAGLEDVVEDLPTLEGNALKKARYTYIKTGIPSLADDTGLEVDALDGRPGVFSARYAGQRATYSENVLKLLGEISESGEEAPFMARFRTVIAFVNGYTEQVFHGVCEGEIILHPRGDKGFGYDPVFVPEGYKLTFAELDPAIKNIISHRAKALRAFREWLGRTA